MTGDQVRDARAAGYAAGYRLDLPSPNPFAPPHVPAWRGQRRGGTASLKGERPALLLARVWRVGYQAGQAAYGRDRGLTAR